MGDDKLLLPEADQWKAIKQLLSFGTRLSPQASLPNFPRKGTDPGCKKSHRACKFCACNNSESHPILPPLTQTCPTWRNLPGEDWQIDFTQMSSYKGLKYLPV